MKTKIAQAIDGTDNIHVVFKPSPDFYDKVGIRRKRFAQLYRGEKSPLLSELEAIAGYVQRPIADLI